MLTYKELAELVQDNHRVLNAHFSGKCGWDHPKRITKYTTEFYYKKSSDHLITSCKYCLKKYKCTDYKKLEVQEIFVLQCLFNTKN